MKKTPSHRQYSQVLAATLLTAMLAATQSAHAATYTWDAGGVATTTWSTDTNWNPDGVPTLAAGDIVDLSTLNIAAATTSTMDTVGGNTLGTIKIGDTNTTHSWTLSLSTPLTLDGNGSAAAINQVSTSKGDTINGAGGIVLASDLNIADASSNALNISTGITATGATRTITINGGGTGQVNFNNAIGSGINLVQNSTTAASFLGVSSASFNGTITVKAGLLSVGTTSAAAGFGAGTSFTLGDTSGSSNAQLDLYAVNGQGYSTPITVASGSSGTKTIRGIMNSGSNTTFITSTIALGVDSSHTADLTVGNATNNSSTWQLRGAVTGFGNLTVKTTNTGKTQFTSASSINNTGTLTNAGTSSGAAQIDAVIGSNVTGVVQNSATSTMNLNAANTSFAGTVTVTTGTLVAATTTALNSNNAVSVASAGTFKAGAATLTIAGLNDSTTGGTVSNTVANTLTLGGSGTYSFSGVIQNGTGTQTLTKSGAGTQTLAGVNTYTGATTVSAGTLSVTGSLASGSAVSVASGATLRGTGTINGATTIASGGTLAAGLSAASIGTLTFTSTLDTTGATVSLKLNSTGGTFDLLTSSGAVTLGSGSATLSLTDIGSGSWTGTSSAFSILHGSSISGTFLGLSDGSTIAVGSNSFTINYTASDVTLTASAIPEPSTYAAIFGGLALVGAVVQRRRRNRQA